MSLPDDIRLQRLQELICRYLREELGLSHDTCIGKEDIESAICFDGIVDDRLHSCVICSIKASSVDLDTGIQRCDLAFMCLEVGIVEVADIYSLCTILSELMGGSPTYAEGRIGS